jgi:hypothetical protein
MAVAVHPKLDIAVEFLDAAMQMSMEGKNYFCVLHLAAAAAELFDAHRRDGATSLFEMAWKAERGMRALETGRLLTDKEAKEVVNRSKNTIKHMNDGEREALKAFAEKLYVTARQIYSTPKLNDMQEPRDPKFVAMTILANQSSRGASPASSPA